MPQGRAPFSRAPSIDDTTIGWRFVNPLMQRALRHRLDARDRRERGRRFGISPRRPGRLRAAQPAARRRGACGRPAGREIVPVAGAAAKGEPVVVDARRAPAARHHARGAGEAAGAVPRRRHGDGRQRLGRQRRRLRAAGRVGGGGATRTASTPRARVVAHGDAPAWRRASWASARCPATRKVLARAGLTLDRDGRDRAERSVRGAGAGRAARARAARRRRAREPERRRHRARPSAGRERRPPGDTAVSPAARRRRPLRAVHHVHRRRPGHRPRSSSGSSPRGARRDARVQRAQRDRGRHRPHGGLRRPAPQGSDDQRWCRHLHAFVREVEPTQEEWMAASSS